jgi:hypothetical protein
LGIASTKAGGSVNVCHEGNSNEGGGMQRVSNFLFFIYIYFILFLRDVPNKVTIAATNKFFGQKLKYAFQTAEWQET